MQIIYFGAPGNGFESYPKNYASSVAIYDKSHRVFGDIECKYIKNMTSVDIIYVIYGLGGEGDGSYRQGRNFGVGIRLDGYEVDTKERKNLYEFLHRFIYEGVNQNTVGLFIPNDGIIKDYKIKTLQESSRNLDKLSSNLKRQFNQEFGRSIKLISNNKSFTEELDPVKLKTSKKKKQVKTENKQDVASKNKQQGIEIDTSQNKNIKEPHIKNTPWWFFLFIPLLAYSIYNGILLHKIKKEVVKNTTSIAKISRKKPKTKTTKTTKKTVLRIEKRDEVEQFFLKPENLPKSINLKIENFDNYMDHLVKLILDSNELPKNTPKEQVISKIVGSNTVSIPEIKDQIEDLNKKNPNDTFFTDIQLPKDLLIWEE